jgi:nucleoside-diphosphate-sugar epimerase
MAEAYVTLINSPIEKIAGKVFNAGYENQSVRQIAGVVQSVVGPDVNIVATETDDMRSYHISSKKIHNELGFVATHDIRNAVTELKNAFEQGKLPDSLSNEKYFNIRRMQSLNLK